MSLFVLCEAVFLKVISGQVPIVLTPAPGTIEGSVSIASWIYTETLSGSINCLLTVEIIS